MVKYLNAELYKVTHRRAYTFGALAVILGGELLLLLLMRFTGNGPTYGDVVYLLPSLLMVGLYLAVMVCDMVFSDQYKLNTLKNEVSCGVSRRVIYLGKLLAAVITAAAFCAVIVAFYLGLGRMLFSVDTDAHDAGTLAEIFLNALHSVAAAFPLWLGGLGFGLMLLFVTRGSTVAMVLFVVVMGPLDKVLQLAQMFMRSEGVVSAVSAVRRWLLVNGFSVYNSYDMAHCWIMGLAWLLISTAIGLIVFQKREIS